MSFVSFARRIGVGAREVSASFLWCRGISIRVGATVATATSCAPTAGESSFNTSLSSSSVERVGGRRWLTAAHPLAADATVFSRGFASVKGGRASRGEPRASRERGGGGGKSAKRGKAKGASSASSDAPPLREVLKNLVRVVHPDLFASSGPEGAAEANDESLKVIQGVLDAVTKSKSIPNAGIKRLKFYVKDADAPDGVRAVPFKFKTTGGDCRNLDIISRTHAVCSFELRERPFARVASQLTRLFEEVGVPSEFRWEPGDWDNDPDTAAINARSNRGGGGDDNTHVAAAPYASSSSRSSGGRSSTQKKPKDLMGALKVNDKLFEAIAAVPWIPEPEGDDRVRAIINDIIPMLVKQGWRLELDRDRDQAGGGGGGGGAGPGREGGGGGGGGGSAVEKIWRGERDESVVMDGVDAASGLALSAIVRHAKNFDRVLGKPTKERLNFYPAVAAAATTTTVSESDSDSE